MTKYGFDDAIADIEFIATHWDAKPDCRPLGDYIRELKAENETLTDYIEVLDTRILNLQSNLSDETWVVNHYNRLRAAREAVTKGE